MALHSPFHQVFQFDVRMAVLAFLESLTTVRVPEKYSIILNHIQLMSPYKLTLRHIGDKAAILLLFLINRLLLLRYVLVVGHISRSIISI